MSQDTLCLGSAARYILGLVVRMWVTDSSARRRSGADSRNNRQRLPEWAGGGGCCCGGGADRTRALCLSGSWSRSDSCARCCLCTMVRQARKAPRPTLLTTGEGGQAPRPSIVGEGEAQTRPLSFPSVPEPPPWPVRTPPLGSGGDSHFPPYFLSFSLPRFVLWPPALFLVPHTRERVKAMFYHAYDSYLENAFPYDELRPLTCDGHDTWGR